VGSVWQLFGRLRTGLVRAEVAVWDGVDRVVPAVDTHDLAVELGDVEEERLAQAPEPLEMTRVPEAELPRTVFINFYNVDADYQQGSQYWRRTVTQSQSDVTLDLPIVFTPTEALDRAQWHMHFAWLERDRFTFYTTRKWSKLTPTDVVVVRGVNIRITSKVESPNGLIKFEGVRAFAGGFTAGGPVTDPIDGGTGGSGGGGQDPGEPPATLVETSLVLLDIPAVSQGDYPFGFYAAGCPAASGRWPGYALFKSIDGGSTYSQIASTSRASTMGTVTADSLASYALGDVVDESTITVALSDAGATLESISGTALTNGGNLCAIRTGSTWELCNFRDAVLVSPATYELTGFLRGRKSTTTAGHADGDDFVMLPTLNVDAPQVELNVALKYKAVTFGMAVADADVVDFTNTGEAGGGSGGEVGSGTFDTIAQNFPIKRKDVTATSYTLADTDRAHLIQFANASTITVTLPTTLPKHWWTFIQNIGAGNLVLDPSGSAKIDGSTSNLTLTTAQGIILVFDGTDYGTSRGMGSNAATLTVKDEGSTLDTAVTSIDFVGAGVTATNVGHAVTATIPLKAPVGASYLTLGTDSDLTSERVLTAGTNVAFVDGGAGSTLTVNVSIPPSAGGAATLISSVTTSGSQASVTFSSIPNTFKDLMIVFQARDTNSSNADGSARMVLNSDTTAANYSATQYTIGSGSTTTTNTAAASSSGIVVANIPGVLNQANALSAGRIIIPNYAGTTFWKAFITQYQSEFNSSPTISAGVMSGSWKSTSAVTSITINCPYTAFVNGSVFSLYGIG
jgi:hypothetical protein